ncbi:MAG TPA: hypothetical protein VG326_12200 [Tepidisphaeraceae bacterium]|jgi:hypothetical protein|nr:hypothetical protein [Tepidisphaeraceae bacterium]
MIVIKGRVIAESAAVLLARIQDANGSAITNATVNSINVKVFDMDENTLAATLDSNTVTVYDALQLDGRWTQDAIGFNLAINVPGSAWTTAGPYRVEAKIIPTAGDSFFILWDLQATEVFST